MRMGFALVLFYLLVSVLAPLALTGLILRAQGLSRMTGELISLTWWMYIIIWWSMIAGPSEKTPRNVQVFTFFYLLFLGIFFLGVWISMTDLFEHLGSGWIPKGRKSITVVGVLLLVGFFFTRRLSASSVVVLLAGILILVLLNIRSHWQSQIVMAGLISFLLVYLTAILTAGLAHEIQPVAPVPADVDEVFYYAPFRRFGFYYLTALLILAASVTIGFLTKSWVAGLLTFFGLFSLFALIVLVTQLVNVIGLGYALIDQIPGADVAQFVDNMADFFNLPAETRQVLQDLASPTVTIEGVEAQGLGTDEGGYFPWPFPIIGG